MARSPSPADSRPPWLEEVEEEPEPAGTSVSPRLLWLVVIGILVLGVGIAIGVAIIAKRSDAPIEVQARGGEIPTIKSPGPWKQRPETPGGTAIEGQGQVIYGAGDGEDPGGTIDLNAVPEDPVLRPGQTPPEVPSLPGGGDSPAEPAAGVDTPPAQPAVRPSPLPTVQPAPAPVLPQPTPAPPKPRAEVVLQPVKPAPKPATPAVVAQPKAAEPAPAAGGTSLQLGAFSSEAKAREAWKTYSKRFAYLSGLSPVILPVKREDTTLYRLRAAGAPDNATAKNLCARLKVAGEACQVVG